MSSLLSLIDDYVPFCTRGSRRRRLPLLSSFMDSVEDEMDQRVGHVFRHLPAVLYELEGNTDGHDPRSKRRKLMKSVSNDEPKSKALVSTKDNRFQVEMDTSNFNPDSIMVKVVGNRVEVAAKHEMKSKDVYEFHEVYRSFDIPEGVDPDSVTSRLSASGKLTIEAPMKVAKELANERAVVIEREDETNKEVESPSKTKSTSTE